MLLTECEDPKPFDVTINNFCQDRDVQRNRAANDMLIKRAVVLELKELLTTVALSRDGKRVSLLSRSTSIIPVDTFAKAMKSRPGAGKRRAALRDNLFCSIAKEAAQLRRQSSNLVTSASEIDTVPTSVLLQTYIRHNVETLNAAAQKLRSANKLSYEKEFSLLTNSFIDICISADKSTPLLLPSVCVARIPAEVGSAVANGALGDIFGVISREIFPIGSPLGKYENAMVRIIHNGMMGFAVAADHPNDCLSMSTSANSGQSNDTITDIISPYVSFGGDSTLPASMTVAFVLLDYEPSQVGTVSGAIVSVELTISIDTSYTCGVHQEFKVESLALLINGQMVEKTVLKQSSAFLKSVSDLMPHFVQVTSPNDTWNFAKKSFELGSSINDCNDLELQRLKISLGGKICVLNASISDKDEERLNFGLVVGMERGDDESLYVSVLEMKEGKTFAELLSPHSHLVSKLTQVARAYAEEIGDLDSEQFAAYCLQNDEKGVAIPLSLFKCHELIAIVDNKRKDIQEFQNSQKAAGKDKKTRKCKSQNRNICITFI